MKLRKLKFKDAESMYEWMMDYECNRNFRFDSTKITLESCKNFIEKSLSDKENLNLAIVNENDEYLGTISLKNINYNDLNAEYAISVRKEYHGTGVAKKATQELLKYAFEELHLNKVYLNVLSENIRAIKFYEKIGFEYEGEFKKHLRINSEYKDLKWYCFLKENYSKQEKDDYGTI